MAERQRSRRALLASIIAIGACGGGTTGTDASGGTRTDGVLISGAITNLLGSGLVMQLNGGRDISPGPNNTQFFFVDVPKKTSYTISVLTQPTNPWQTCAVANGTGTATADNGTASLTCTTNTYAVRGTIGGLTGTGLSLQLNGGTAQSVTAGATSFAFPALASGSAVAITIASQPAGQTCTINGGAGRITSGEFTTAVITCGAPGFTIGGDYIFGGSLTPPTFRLNGGPAVSFGPGVDQPPFPTFTFPTTLRTGDLFSVTLASQPQQTAATCLLNSAKGRMAAANVTSVGVQCFQYGAFEGLEGSYTATLNNRRQYLTVWADGTYTLTTRLDDVSCTNAGNGVEYGAYRRTADGTFKSRNARMDTNGGCGLNDSAVPFSNAPNGRLLRVGANLTLAVPGDTLTVLTFTPAVQQPGSLVGAWVRADGVDGTVIVFQTDGTYLAVESQNGVNLNLFGGYERGCYVAGASSFTSTVGTGCTPDNLPSIDNNGRDGGFAGRGAIPFTLTGANAATIDGLTWRRMVPNG